MFTRRMALLLLVVLTVPPLFARGTSGTPAQAGKPEPPATGPRIALSAPIAAPGERAVVVARIDGLAGAAVRSITTDVEFPGGMLTFVEARPAFHQDLTVDAKLQPNVDPKAKSRLSLTATGKTGIGEGDVFELVFEVSRAVYTDRDAPVAAVTPALKMADGSALEKVAVKDGKVAISVASVVFGCFFYMH